jgi:hypothetical protein
MVVSSSEKQRFTTTRTTLMAALDGGATDAEVFSVKLPADYWRVGKTFVRLTVGRSHRSERAARCVVRGVACDLCKEMKSERAPVFDRLFVGAADRVRGTPGVTTLLNWTAKLRPEQQRRH